MNEESKQELTNKAGFPWVWAVLVIIIIVIAGTSYYYFSPSNSKIMTTDIKMEEQESNAAQVIPTTSIESLSRKFTIEGNEFAYSQSVISVDRGDKVQLTFKNTGNFPHDLAILDLGVQSKTIQPGEQDTVSFIAEKTGSFEFKCTVGNHAEKGMVGTLIIK